MSDINEIKYGFEPVYDRHSIVLILGSFPSVKSREIRFYYGNRQNRFWSMLFSYFGVPYFEETEKKRAFLLEKGIALWDIVTACRIVGSKDDTLEAVELADLTKLFHEAPIRAVLLNGSKAFSLYEEQYGNLPIPHYKMPSTSPANPRFRKEIWWSTFDELF